MILYETLTPGYAMLISPKQDETAVHDCHSTGTACVKVRPDRGDVLCDHCIQMDNMKG